MSAPYSVPTLNRMGYVACGLDEPSVAFARYAATCPLPVLDVGAGFGLATAAALDAGATVVANDLSGAHLAFLAAATPPAYRPRLTLRVGRFPDELDFPGGAFGAVHASRVFHFLTPDQVEQGLARAFDRLAPGGKLFLHATTPFGTGWGRFVPVFAARKKAGERWPGMIEDVRAYDDEPDPDMPPFLHVFDAATLAAGARRAGFVVEACRMFTPSRYPPRLRHDGRETVELIARKPARRR